MFESILVGRWWTVAGDFFGGFAFMGRLLWGNVRLNTFPGQLLGIGAVKCQFSAEGKSLRSWAEAFAVWRSLLGDGGFGCGLHLGLCCGRLLDLHWLSDRSLFFAGAGYCCLSCGGPDACGFLRPSYLRRAPCELKRLFSQLPGDCAALRFRVAATFFPAVLRMGLMFPPASSGGTALHLKFIRHASTFERCKCGRGATLWDGASLRCGLIWMGAHVDSTKAVWSEWGACYPGRRRGERSRILRVWSADFS